MANVLDHETHYLGDLVRAWVAKSQVPVVPPPDLDPDRFLRLLASHPAASALAPHVDRRALPESEWERLQRALALARQRTTWMLLELERILPALDEVSCTPVVLKGAALALGTYARPEDRWFMDLDILLRRDELPTAYDALERLGYRRQGSAALARSYDEHHFHRILRSPHGIFLEVHWALTLPHSVYKYDLEAMRREARPIPMGRATLMAPSAVDQILHGVLQSIAAGFSDLRRILDLHLLEAELSDVDRQCLADRAIASGLDTGLWLQYRIREEITGIAMPAIVGRTCRPSIRTRRVIDRLDIAAGCLTQRGVHQEGYEHLLHWLCTPPRQRAREVRRFLVPDADAMFMAGCPPEQLDSAARRLRMILQRVRTSGRILGYLARHAG